MKTQTNAQAAARMEALEKIRKLSDAQKTEMMQAITAEQAERFKIIMPDQSEIFK